MTVNLHTQGGVDYLSGPYNVTFAAWQFTASFVIPLLDDHIVEDNEDFTLHIDQKSLPDCVSVGNPNQAIVIIIDDDSK